MTFTPMEGYDYWFKVLLLGDSGVGKTCVVHQFKSGAFKEKYDSTLGVEFATKTLLIDGKRVKLQIWDTAGQERFRCITQNFYRGAKCAIVVYDVTQEESFLNVPQWFESVDKYLEEEDVFKVLIGNKSDLAEQRKIPFSEGECYAAKSNIPFFLETSAKSTVNVNELFFNVATSLLNSVSPNPETAGSSKLTDSPKHRLKKCSSC